MTDKIKLIYFDLPGRGEQIRCLLRHAKVPFEDYRIPMDKWPAEKANGKFEYGQIPVIEINGKMYSQSPAIMHLLAVKYGYMPADLEQQYHVINVYNAGLDVINAFAKWSYQTKDPKEKEDLKKDYFEKLVPFMFGKFEERLKEQKNKLVMVGEKISYADFAFAGLAKAEFMTPTNASLYEPTYKNCPLLKAYFTELMKL